MSIEKKSLISTLKTTKKANAAKDDITGATTVSPTQKLPIRKVAAQKLASKAVAAQKLASKAVAAQKLATKLAAKQ